MVANSLCVCFPLPLRLFNLIVHGYLAGMRAKFFSSNCLRIDCPDYTKYYRWITTYVLLPSALVRIMVEAAKADFAELIYHATTSSLMWSTKTKLPRHTN